MWRWCRAVWCCRSSTRSRPACPRGGTSADVSHPSSTRHRDRARGGYDSRSMRPEAEALYERLFGNKERDAAVADRIPPGQYRTEKFPVLHYGSVPKTDLATWDFKVYGLV